MQFRFANTMRQLILGASVLQVSPWLMAQDSGLIEYAPMPQWGNVAAAVGTSNAPHLPPRVTRIPGQFVSHASTVLPAAQKSPTTQLPSSSGPQLSGSSDLSKLPADETAADEVYTNEGNTQAREESLAPLKNRALSIAVQVVDLSVADLGTHVVPNSAAAERTIESNYMRAASSKCVHWQPSNICHYPLRFEDAMLERHGQVRFGCWQSLASGIRFFGTIPMIPYLNSLRPRCEPVYALGNYRAGSCAPALRSSIPWDRDAAFNEALALAGFFWAAPL